MMEKLRSNEEHLIYRNHDHNSCKALRELRITVRITRSNFWTLLPHPESDFGIFLK